MCCSPCSRTCASHAGADPGARRSRGRARAMRRREASDDKYHGVNRFNVITGAQVVGQAERALLHQGVRAEPDRGGAQGRQDRRHHRGDAGRHRPRPVRRGVSRPHLRRRHRRAARRDIRRGPCGRRLQAVRGHLLHLPAARLRPGRARRRDPAPAGALCARSCRTGGRGRAHARTAPSTSPISAACRASC